MKKMEVLHDDGSSAHILQFKLFFFFRQTRYQCCLGPIFIICHFFPLKIPEISAKQKR